MSAHGEVTVRTLEFKKISSASSARPNKLGRNKNQYNKKNVTLLSVMHT